MKAEGSPTSRALQMLELLQNHPGITAEQLALRLGVSARAVRRYVEILREAEIPVEAIRGPGGGYRLGRGVRLPPLVFNAPEALGLVMAVLDGQHPAADSSDPVGSALSKLLRALPRAVAQPAEAVRATAAAAPNPSAARPDPQLTVQLVQACAAQRRVRMRYRSEAGAEWTSDADPWAVVVRYSRWYLLCHSLRANAVRAYRLDRIRSLEVLEETADRPADLDPVDLLEAHLSDGWEYATEVIIPLPSTTVASWLPRSLGQLESLSDNETRLTGSTSDPHWYAAQLVALPAGWRVTAGPELRKAVRELGETITAAAGR